MKRISLLTAVALFSAVTLMGQSKLSNHTALLLEGRKSNAEFRNTPMAKTVKTVNGKEYVDCFVHFAGQIDESVLAAYGAQLHCRYDFMNVVTAAVPIDAIEPLSENENIKLVEAGTPVAPKMDLARSSSHVDEVLNGLVPLTKSYLGRGVVVGVVDGDMQLNHPAFWDASHTRYRIKRYWKQSGTQGTHPANFDYGSEFSDSATILRAKYDTRGMTSGHATHVTGIAAGADHTKNYYGVAQEADIVYVSYGAYVNYESYNSTAIPDGIKYCIDYAKSVGKPCVVNVSMGMTLGPHDGNSTESKIIDGLVGPGYIVVGSAGNSGDEQIHAGKLLDGANDTSFITFVSVKKNQYGTYATMDVYGDINQDCSLQFVAYNKDDKNCTYACEPLDWNTGPTRVCNLDTVIGDYGRLKCNVSIRAEKTDNNRAHFTVNVSKMDSVPKRHNVGLMVTSRDSGMVNMWSIEDYSTFTNSNQKQIVDGDSEYTVDEPMGVTEGVISVGSYTTRPYEGSKAKAQDISGFSSHGPTADNRVKPDIVAPGEFIMSAYPDLEGIKDGREESTTVGGETFYYGLMQGTSMSSPYCAGVIATWLEADPQLTVEKIHETFQHTAMRDQYTGYDIPNNSWGQGKLNAYAGLLYVLGLSTKVQDVTDGVLAVYPNPTSDMLNIGFPADDSNVNIAIYDLSGKCVYNNSMNVVYAGQNVEISVSDLTVGAYVVRVSGSKINDTLKLMKE